MRPRLARGGWVCLLLCVVTLSSSARAASIPPTAFQDLHWRCLGPYRGGWATAVAGVPGDAAHHYFGSADGGMWETMDAGSTWHSISEGLRTASIGALAIAPSDPRTLWVGTGQIHQRWDIVSGDGVYRSTDGGRHWEHRGLGRTQHIGAIWIDPRDSEVVVVAALGHVFGPNEERGIYRTEDGGDHWTRVLYLDADTGGADLANDPAHPDLLYATLWQLRRHPWLDYFQPTLGPGSGIYRSEDGGKSWRPTGRKGLPEGDLGRIEVAVARNTAARRLYAAVQASRGSGVYRSDDGGASWRLVNGDGSLTGSYMSGLFPDPEDPDVVWGVGQPLRRSADGGETFTIVRSSPGGDDYHTLWIDPQNRDHMITGADQGAVLTLNGGRSWSSWYNQPTGQFYRLAVDQGFPYRIYSGQQDSGSIGISSRSDYGQLSFRDWTPVGADERDGDIPDPEDAEIVYGAGLGGRVSRWNRLTGQVQNISPWPVSSYAARPGTVRYRYDWITPLAVAQVEPHALYLGAQVLFRSMDKGRSWEVISGDLSGAPADADGCEGKASVENATDCGYGTIFAIAPSPLDADLIWVGTDNGRVHLTRDGGLSWQEVTPGGMGDWTKVNIIDASRIDAGTAYVAADRHRLDEDSPLIYRTHDFGQSWTLVVEGLPPREWTGAVRQDPVSPSLLYAGTNRGMYVSFDDGEKWQSLQLDLAVTGINDIVVHEDDVVVATQGRAIWALDDVSPLRHLATHGWSGDFTLVQPSDAYRLRFNQNRDTPMPPEEPRGENPPVGAVIDYLLPEAAEVVQVEILDSNGRLLRRIRSDDPEPERNARIYFADLWLGPTPRPQTTPGHHRFVWDLRLRAPETLRSSYAIAAVPGRPTPIRPEGAMVPPGLYTLRLMADGRRAERPLQVLADPRVEASPGDYRELYAFQSEVVGVLERAVEIAHQVGELVHRLSEATEDGSPQALASLREAQGEGRHRAAAVANELTSLATDLEAADALPAGGQRALLEEDRRIVEERQRSLRAWWEGLDASMREVIGNPDSR